MNDISLLTSDPIIFKGIPIYKPTLREIFSIGKNQFNRSTKLLTLSDIEIGEYYKKCNIENGELEPFLFIFNSAKEKTFFLELQFAFFTYIKKQVILSKEGFSFNFEEKGILTIRREDFSEFQNIIRKINCDYDEIFEREIITDDLKRKEKFMNARKLLRQAKEKEKKRQLESDSVLTLEDIISGLCVYNAGYNLYNVWDLTLYQLQDQFQKCRNRENYEHNFQILLAGGDKTKIHLTDWLKNN